ncbi:glucose-6-phosphate dehydrogenase [Rhodococcus aerolatus]
MADDTRPGPTIFILYGATGDLAKRMVLPAFYELAAAGLLPEDFWLVGNGRGDESDDDFVDRVRESLEEFGDGTDAGPWDRFRTRLKFAGKGFTPDNPGELVDVVEGLRGGEGGASGGDYQLVHYIALPPSTFTDYTRAIGEHGLAEGARVVYEKPFGTSQQNFTELDEAVHDVLDEKQVYRIDHFLGKEASQNLHVLRFANDLVGGVWNNRHVEQVQIDVPEELDIDTRAEFYDATGAVLDMLVTHLFQIAAEVAMEPPTSMSADDLQTARETVIAAFRPLADEDVVLGQFEGYTGTEGVAEGSQTDTFVAARLWVDTDRWHGVPFLLRTGKQMAVSEQRVSLVMKAPDGPLTHVPPQGTVLTFSLKGDGSVGLSLVVKEPGPELELTVGRTELNLAAVPDAEPLPPYARLIHDVLQGDRSLFTRPDGLAHVWEVAAPLLDDRPAVQPYERGSMGPQAAIDLAGDTGWLLTGQGS